MRTLDDFDFKVSPVPMPQIRELAEGSYLDRAEPVLFLGDSDPATFCTSLLRY